MDRRNLALLIAWNCVRKLHTKCTFFYILHNHTINLSIHHQKKHERRRHQWIIISSMPFDRGGIVHSFAQGWIIAMQNMKSESGKKWRLWIWFCGARRYDAILEWMEIDGWPVWGGEGEWLSPINELLYSLLDYIMYYATDWMEERMSDRPLNGSTLNYIETL